MESFSSKFAPVCPYCGRSAELVSGAELYPGKRFAEKLNLWRCVPCDAHVGCHQGTIQPLGTPARLELRRARSALHREVLDPLWTAADELACYSAKRERNSSAIKRAARSRVYGWLSEKLGLPLEKTHVGMFDLETCRAARELLEGIEYMQIRGWHNDRKRTEKTSAMDSRNLLQRKVVSQVLEGENGR